MKLGLLDMFNNSGLRPLFVGREAYPRWPTYETFKFYN